MKGEIVTLMLPFGPVTVPLIVTSSCEDAERLRATVTGPAIVACRCRVARALLVSAEPAEAREVQRFALALTATAGADQ